jgi:hypothetical protein
MIVLLWKPNPIKRQISEISSMYLSIFLEIKNRVEPSASKSSEDLRVRLDKRRHVVRRPSQNDEIVVRKPSRNDDVVIRKLSQSDVDTESPPGSPPVKIVKIDEERHPDSSVLTATFFLFFNLK